MNMRKILNFIVAAVLAASVFSCKTTSPCPEKPAIGNAGSLFNTQYEEYAPTFFDDYMFFTATNSQNAASEKLYKSKITGEEFSPPILDTTLPMNNFANSGAPNFYFDESSGVDELFFAGILPGSKSMNRDLFAATRKNGVWSEAEPLTSLNGPSWESYPAVSADGKVLVFASDREGGLGGIDLYASVRVDGQWSEPANLGESVNTPADEISPYIDRKGDLYFASKGYTENSGYDIIKAKGGPGGLWRDASALPFPMNTEWDETGPATFRDKLYLASNRKGGCGGNDIYSFQICGPVFMEGMIESDDIPLPKRGTVEVYDSFGELEKTVEVGEDGFFRSDLLPEENYLLKYINNCIPDYISEKRFQTPCSDSTYVKMVVNFALPDDINIFTFEKYNVPFFVSGYYYPNTTENLNALRLKFAYGLFGTSDSTRYIDNPGEKYDVYAMKIDEALKDAADFILKRLSYLQSSCIEGGEKLKIFVTGYADPRPLSEVVKYADETIDDPESELYVERGEPMTNELLSSLRAYYTAKELQQMIRDNDRYIDAQRKIEWIVEGEGVDESDMKSNEMKRRVSIRIGVEK